ncbi:ATP-dependent DNA helicase II subunit 1 [Podosphaera aphanis]|nr:ATP-dependent DNA helicase II subunit 1 [Podosphaera aphanis]
MSASTSRKGNTFDSQNDRCNRDLEYYEDEDEEEEMDDSNYVTQKDALLFAIEVSESMLCSYLGGESPTAAAIKCAYQIMQQRIISSPKDVMGVLLFGTEMSKFIEENLEKKRGLEYPHCYLLIEMNVPSSDDVKVLRSVAHGDNESKDILVPSKEPTSISNMLFCANQIFAKMAQGYGSKRLFIITDNDNPHKDNKKANHQAVVRARDLFDLGVTLELFPVPRQGRGFNREKFYDDIIHVDYPDEEEEAQLDSNPKLDGDGIFNLSNLILDTNSKQVAKRALFSGLPFEIGPNFKISVNGYNLLHRPKPARSCWIYDEGEQLQKATVESGLMTDDTSIEVKKADIKKAYTFGGSQVFFSPEEQKALRFFESPVLRIIGFKPKNMLPIWASVNKSTFIYPTEEHHLGSTRVFAALWKKLIDAEKMGVAWYIPRSNATPTLVCILPSQEQPGESKAKTLPAGLWLYTLPFADDLRSTPPIPPPVGAPDILIDEMRTIIQQLQLPGGKYDPFKYPNPALQWHYRILQAIALGDDVLDLQKEDKTQPRFRQIEKRAGPYVKKWRGTLEEHIRAYQKCKYGGIDGTKLKRGVEKDETTRPNKRAKK